MPLFTDSPRLFKAVLSVLLDDPDILVEVTADPVTLNCIYTVGCPSDEEKVDRTVRAHQRGEPLSITVSAAERAEALCRDLTREAKKNAQPRTLEEEARVAVVRERERRASQSRPTAFTAMQKVLQEASSRDAVAKAAKLTADADRWTWSRVDGPRPDNLGIPQEELPKHWRGDDDGEGA